MMIMMQLIEHERRVWREEEKTVAKFRIFEGKDEEIF